MVDRGPASFLTDVVDSRGRDTVEVTIDGVEVVVVNAGSDRLKVSSSPPVPKPESGPSVCIVFNVNVGALLLFSATRAGPVPATGPVTSLPLADGLLCRMILGCAGASWATGRTVMLGALGIVDGVIELGRTISMPR